MNDSRSILEKEIDLVQACINRMSQNSFMVKGWTIALVAVVLALLPEKIDVLSLNLACFVATLCLWFLDAFYLKMEKLYRWKYEWIIARRPETMENAYDLNPYNKKMWLPLNGNERNEPKVPRVMFTKTLVPIYAPLLILSITNLIIELV